MRRLVINQKLSLQREIHYYITYPKDGYETFEYMYRTIVRLQEPIPTTQDSVLRTDGQKPVDPFLCGTGKPHIGGGIHGMLMFYHELGQA